MITVIVLWSIVAVVYLAISVAEDDTMDWLFAEAEMRRHMLAGESEVCQAVPVHPGAGGQDAGNPVF